MKLTIKGLTKSYGSIRALSQFSYEFGPGIYGILGANGAGKSTLFELLTDTLRRDCGEILWNGVDILKLGGRYRAKVGYMPQVGLSAAADRKLGQFSGGMRQRALLAQAMLGDPPLLILDEPTSGVDPQERIRIRGLIARATQNHIVLLATHVVSDVECIANQVLLMNSGTLLKSGTPEELIASIETKVAQRFCTPEEIELYQHQHSVSLLFQRQGGQLLRLVGDDLPAEFEPAAGIGLEEVYLYYCAGNKAINT